MKITAKFREYENGAMKGYVDLTVDGKVGIKDARLVEGSNGLFVAMPQIKVGEDYRDVVTGVSKEFAALALEATVAAKDSEEKRASIGEAGDLYYGVHANALSDQSGAVKALASLTVRENETAEKSAFTINGIRVIQGEKNMFLGMPNVKTGNEEYPYNDLCYLTDRCEDFVSGLVISKAMDALGMEKKRAAKEEPAKGEPKKKDSLDDKMKDANGRKGNKGGSKKDKDKEKEAEMSK